jgi:uncharacterized protein YeeX (DUF496 family)
MIWWIIQATVLSVLFIFIVHNLIHFLKSNLTVPKIKDLVNTTSQKYDNMYNVIQSVKREDPKETSEYVINDLLPSEERANMKNELKNFLKSQLQSTGTSVTSLEGLSYSNY